MSDFRPCLCLPALGFLATVLTAGATPIVEPDAAPRPVPSVPQIEDGMDLASGHMTSITSLLEDAGILDEELMKRAATDRPPEANPPVELPKESPFRNVSVIALFNVVFALIIVAAVLLRARA